MNITTGTDLHYTKPTARNRGDYRVGNRGRKVWTVTVDGVEYQMTRKGDAEVFVREYLRSAEAVSRSAGSHEAGFEKWLVATISDRLHDGDREEAIRLQNVLAGLKFV